MPDKLPEREPDPGVQIHTPASLADLNGIKRQAIDGAIRRKKLKAYRYPGTNRIWIHNDDVPTRYRPTEGLAATIRQLAITVAELQATLESHASSPHPSPAADGNPTHATGASPPPSSHAETHPTSDEELTRLRAENATLQTINQLLLAEVADRDDHDALRDEALDLMRQANTKQEEAHQAIKSSRAKIREALAQTQLPPAPPQPS